MPRESWTCGSNSDAWGWGDQRSRHGSGSGSGSGGGSRSRSGRAGSDASANFRRGGPARGGPGPHDLLEQLVELRDERRALAVRYGAGGLRRGRRRQRGHRERLFKLEALTESDHIAPQIHEIDCPLSPSGLGRT